MECLQPLVPWTLHQPTRALRMDIFPSLRSSDSGLLCFWTSAPNKHIHFRQEPRWSSCVEAGRRATAGVCVPGDALSLESRNASNCKHIWPLLQPSIALSVCPVPATPTSNSSGTCEGTQLNHFAADSRNLVGRNISNASRTVTSGKSFISKSYQQSRFSADSPGSGSLQRCSPLTSI